MPYALCSFPMRLIAFGVSKCVIDMGNHSCQCSQRYGMDGGVYVSQRGESSNECIAYNICQNLFSQS